MHSCQIDKASNLQILENIKSSKSSSSSWKSPQKITKKLKAKKENYDEAFNQIRYNIKVEAVTSAKV